MTAFSKPSKSVSIRFRRPFETVPAHAGHNADDQSGLARIALTGLDLFTEGLARLQRVLEFEFRTAALPPLPLGLGIRRTITLAVGRSAATGFHDGRSVFGAHLHRNRIAPERVEGHDVVVSRL